MSNDKPNESPAIPELPANPAIAQENQSGLNLDLNSLKGLTLPAAFPEWKDSGDGFECNGKVCRPKALGDSPANPILPASYRAADSGGLPKDGKTLGPLGRPVSETGKVTPLELKLPEAPLPKPVEPGKLPEAPLPKPVEAGKQPVDAPKPPVPEVPGVPEAPKPPVLEADPVVPAKPGDPPKPAGPEAPPAVELDVPVPPKPGEVPGTKPTDGPLAPPAIEVDVPPKPGDGGEKGKFIDGGQFETDPQGRIIKTVSADGTKVREFGYENPENPDEITKIKIDGNREYFKKPGEDAFTYFKDGQEVGQWNGTVKMEKNGLYNYNQSDEGQAHYFGSARAEIQPPTKPNDGTGTTNDTTGGGNVPDTSGPKRPDGGLPLVPDVTPGPVQPDKPIDKPADNNDRRKETDEAVEKAKRETKERYTTAETEKALRNAALTGKKLVVHLGMAGCGPCGDQDAGVWNQRDFQKELKDNGISLLKLDRGEAVGGRGGDLAKRLDRNNSGYPTILEVQPFINQAGQVDFKVTNKATGFIGKDGTRNLLHMSPPEQQQQFRQPQPQPKYYKR